MKKLQNHCRKTVLTVLVMMATVAFVPSTIAALVNYSQDFEGMHVADAAALGNDGWRIFANVGVYSPMYMTPIRSPTCTITASLLRQMAGPASLPSLLFRVTSN